MKVYTVRLEWAYEGESLRIATVNRDEAWSLFVLEGEDPGNNHSRDTEVVFSEWESGEEKRSLSYHLGSIREWKDRKWVPYSG